MNRSQKIAWWVVVWMGAGMIAAGVAVAVSYAASGFPKAWAGLSFLGIGGFGGLAPYIFRKDPGPVQFDERDRAIQLKAARAGFAMSYLVFGLLAMGIWMYCRWRDMSAVSIEVLPMIWILGVFTMFISSSLMTLLLYRRDSKSAQGESL